MFFLRSYKFLATFRCSLYCDISYAYALPVELKHWTRHLLVYCRVGQALDRLYHLGGISVDG
jgi:hypothetical protein